MLAVSSTDPNDPRRLLDLAAMGDGADRMAAIQLMALRIRFQILGSEGRRS
jgi:hypothetical protein